MRPVQILTIVLSVWAIGLPAASAQQKQDKVASSLAARPISTQVPFAVAFNPKGDLAAVGTGDGRLIVWSPRDSSEYSVQDHANWTFCIAWSRDGSRLITGGGDDLIHIRNAHTLELLGTLKGHSDDVHAIALSPDNTVLYSVGDDRLLIAWNVDSGEQIYSVPAHDEQIAALAISPDGKMLATGSRDDTVRLWNAADGKALHTFTGHLNDVLDLDFSPDGRWLASASYDTTVMLWDVQQQTREAVIQEHKDRVFAVEFAPDSQWLWSGGEDNALVATHLTGDRASSKLGVSGDIARLDVSPDGSARAYTSSDGYLRWTTWTPGTRPSSSNRLKVDPTAEILER